MQSKISTKWLLFGVGVVGIIFSTTIVFFMAEGLNSKDNYKKISAFTRSQNTQKLVEVKSIKFNQSGVSLEQAKAGVPVRIKIPKLNINTDLAGVGLTLQGAVDAPKMPTTVAWFNLGPRPGEKGSSVIIGHYGWKNGVPAAFDNLHKLQKGDKIYIQDENMVTSTFVVTGSQSYSQKANTNEIFFSRDGKSHLNLITCGGIWSKADKSYSKRIVVFTDKV
jgi:LPXTG-site transpeptidase (sortase) family protein